MKTFTQTIRTFICIPNHPQCLTFEAAWREISNAMSGHRDSVRAAIEYPVEAVPTAGYLSQLVPHPGAVLVGIDPGVLVRDTGRFDPTTGSVLGAGENRYHQIVTLLDFRLPEPTDSPTDPTNKP